MSVVCSEVHKISIIIPVYNAECFLRRCVESVLSQSYTNTEIILVDDGSTDSSLKICREFECRDNRIRVISQQNAGAAAARNAGIEKATGDIISFVDSDDYINSDMYRSMLSLMDAHELDIVTCGRINEYGNGTTSKEFELEYPVIMSKYEAMKRFLTWDGVDSSPCDKLYRRYIFAELRFPTGKRVEDLLLMPLIFSRAEKIGHTGNALYHYCHRKESASTSFDMDLGLTLFLSVAETKDILKNLYPQVDFNEEFKFFSYQQYLLAWQILQVCRYQGYEILEIRKSIKECLTDLMKSKKIDKRNLVITSMLFCGAFGPVWRLKHKVIK